MTRAPETQVEAHTPVHPDPREPLDRMAGQASTSQGAIWLIFPLPAILTNRTEYNWGLWTKKDAIHLRQKRTFTCNLECSGQKRGYHSSPARSALSLVVPMMKMKGTNSIISKAFSPQFSLTTVTCTLPEALHLMLPPGFLALHPWDADLSALNPSLNPPCLCPSSGPALMQKLCDSQKSSKWIQS